MQAAMLKYCCTAAIALFWALYVAVYAPPLFSLITLSRVFAATSGILFGIALTYRPLVRTFRIEASPSLDVKWLGLAAYVLALVHTALALYLQPELYTWGLPAHFLSLDVFLGIFALTIFTAMTFLPMKTFARLVPVKDPRAIFRLGVYAYAALVLRAFVIDGGTWLAWVTAPQGLMPPRMLLSIFALVCIAAVLYDRMQTQN